jgi:hypothetical protein
MTMLLWWRGGDRRGVPGFSFLAFVALTGTHQQDFNGPTSEHLLCRHDDVNRAPVNWSNSPDNFGVSGHIYIYIKHERM